MAAAARLSAFPLPALFPGVSFGKYARVEVPGQSACRSVLTRIHRCPFPPSKPPPPPAPPRVLPPPPPPPAPRRGGGGGAPPLSMSSCAHPQEPRGAGPAGGFIREAGEHPK